MLNKKVVGLAAAGCIGAGTAILILGCILGGRPGYFIDREGVHAAGTAESREPYVQKKIKIDEFSSMNIDLEYADLEVIPSDDYYLEYRIEGSNRKPVWSVKNGKLTFNEREMKGFGSFMVWGTTPFESDGNYKVKIYIPEDKALENVRISSDDGDVVLPDLTVKSLSTTCEYGDLSVESLSGDRWDVTMDNGVLKAGNVETEKVVVDNEYGDCIFDRVIGDTVKVTLDDGNLKVNSMDVRDFRVENEYGDVELTTADSWEKYDMDLHTEYGQIILPDGRNCSNRDGDEEQYRVANGNDKKISANSDDGDIHINTGKN